MPLYELVCIAQHSAQLAPLRSLTASASSLVHNNGGVVRTLDHWGTRNLPARAKIGKRRGGGGSAEGGPGAGWIGDYWTMRFDCNPPTLTALNERLRLDPLVLRWTTLKVGSTLSQVTNPPTDPTIRYNRPLPEEMSSNGSQR
ncbi:bS6m family ribosomal protein [Sporobolomyces salmoneus]|uniref:bS6m family ribosomal protein n=1 Tax=Sporobolomyces salmoneus TaxID=183962 RepID=UPI0031724126